MGMFDNLICRLPLEGNPPIEDWQTKSYLCEMGTITITSNGTIQWKPWHAKRARLLKTFRGEIFFDAPDPDDTCWEYSALFDDGRLLSMKRFSPRRIAAAKEATR